MRFEESRNDREVTMPSDHVSHPAPNGAVAPLTPSTQAPAGAAAATLSHETIASATDRGSEGRLRAVLAFAKGYDELAQRALLEPAAKAKLASLVEARLTPERIAALSASASELLASCAERDARRAAYHAAVRAADEQRRALDSELSRWANRLRGELGRRNQDDLAPFGVKPLGSGRRKGKKSPPPSPASPT